MPFIGKLGTRHVQLLLITACVTSGTAINYSLAVAIVAMSDSKNHSWTSREISLVLSAFNWGFITLLIPSGYLVNLFSPKRLFAYGLLFGSTSTLFMPLLVHWAGWKGACIGRMALGLGEAFINVGSYSLLSKWAPPKELSRMCAIMTSGHFIGGIITTLVSGFIASSWMGWPGIFYFFGVCGVIPALLMAVYGADSPQVHPSISPNEKAFIAESFREVKNFTEFKSRKVPWKAMLTSLPVWGIIIAQCGLNWGGLMSIYELLMYMKHVLRFETAKISLLLTSGYTAEWLLIYIFGWTSDYLRFRGFRVCTLRRFFNTLGMWTAALIALGLSFCGPEHETLTIVFYILWMGMYSGGFCGFVVNQIDLSPNFAGTIQSIVIFVGMLMWIIAPIVCGAIVTDLMNIQQWKILFYISASIFFLSNFIFIIFASGDIQPWDGLSNHEQNENNEESKKRRESTVTA